LYCCVYIYISATFLFCFCWWSMSRFIIIQC
jgi:hypothetical protein